MTNIRLTAHAISHGILHAITRESLVSQSVVLNRHLERLV